MYYSTPTANNATTSIFPAPAISSVAIMRWSSLIGIITAITGNILISFALNIQRYAHIRLHHEHVERRERLKKIAKGLHGGYGTNGSNGTNGQVGTVLPEARHGENDQLRSSFHSESSRSSGYSQEENQDSTYLSSPYWWGGIVLMTIGEAGNFLAYGFAPASIVSPLGVVALISNCVIAPIMLKERFRIRDFWGVVVAVAGAAVVVLSAKQGEKKLGPHEIWGAITAPVFEIYMVVTVVLIGLLVWASPKYGNKTILIDLGLVGLFGGYTALSTKGVASMLSSTLWRALTTPVTYGLLAVLVGTAIMQVKYVNKALQRFDSTQVIPIQFVTFTLSVIIGSAILYRDFEKATADSVSKFIGGCLLTFFGVFLITSGRPPREDDEDDESDGEGEERINLANQDSTCEDSQSHEHKTKRRRQPHDGHMTSEDMDSRRSSRVSFMEPSSLPRISQMFSNSFYQPGGRVVPPILPLDPQDNETTPLLGTVGANPTDDIAWLSRQPEMLNATSTPQLPSEVQLSTGNTLKPPQTPRTLSQGNVHAHLNPQTTLNSAQGDRPMTPARHSISRMMPGPLLSPLSGGLSAVVADSLMRGVDVPVRNRSFRRPRLGLRTGSQRLLRHDMDEDEDMPSSPSKAGPETAGQDLSKSLGSNEGRGEWSRLTRARSMSNTLADLFRVTKYTSDRPSAADDEEAGPSGQ